MLRALARHGIVGLGMLAVAALTYAAAAVVIPALLGLDASGRGPFAVAATAILALRLPSLRSRLRRLATRWVYGQRLSPLEVLSTASRGLSQAGRTDAALAEIAAVVAAGTGATRCAVSLRVDDELVEVTSHPTDSGAADVPRMAHDFSVSVNDDGEVVGVISVTTSRPLTATERKLMRDVAVRAGVALRNARLTAELDAAVRRTEGLADELVGARRMLVARQDAERHAIERTLHDETQQYLVALLITLQRAARTATKSPAKVAELVAEAARLHGEVSRMLAAVVDDVEPWSPEAIGLEAALRAHADRLRLPVRVTAGAGLALTDEVTRALYYTCLEAIHNAVKHGHATAIGVDVRHDDRTVVFSVTDDGNGFDPDSVGTGETGGTGVAGMARRVATVGGELSVRSRPGFGATVEGRVPLDRASVPA